jgi:hypothetical protein
MKFIKKNKNKKQAKQTKTNKKKQENKNGNTNVYKKIMTGTNGVMATSEMMRPFCYNDIHVYIDINK